MRHNLSLNKCFEKVENKMSGSSRKGCLWALNLARIDKMEEEMHKWKRKDLAAIHRSMANPGEPWTPLAPVLTPIPHTSPLSLLPQLCLHPAPPAPSPNHHGGDTGASLPHPYPGAGQLQGLDRNIGKTVEFH